MREWLIVDCLSYAGVPTVAEYVFEWRNVVVFSYAGVPNVAECLHLFRMFNLIF